MSVFEDLQKKKVEVAVGLLTKLPQNLKRMRDYQLMGEHAIVQEWMLKLADALKELKDLIEKQKDLCPKDGNCNSLLNAEIVDVQRAIDNLKLAARAATELNEIALMNVLTTISSKQHSLANLLKTDQALAA